MIDKTDIHAYDDIIHLPHPTSKTHPRMSMYNRAAQFSPFAALTGHDAAIKETARLTDTKVELDEMEKARLDEKIQMIMQNLSQNPVITVTYFIPDEKKAGGAYTTYTGCVKRMDGYEHVLIMQDKTRIPIEEIYEIDSDLFARYGLMEL